MCPDALTSKVPSVNNTVVVDFDVLKRLNAKRMILLITYMKFNHSLTDKQFITEYSASSGYSETYIRDLLRDVKSIANKILERKGDVSFLAVSLQDVLHGDHRNAGESKSE